MKSAGLWGAHLVETWKCDAYIQNIVEPDRRIQKLKPGEAKASFHLIDGVGLTRLLHVKYRQSSVSVLQLPA